MPYRTIPLVNDQFYHIYNRGVNKGLIFKGARDHQRFIKALAYYQLEGPKPKFSHFTSSSLVRPDPNKKIVEIISYCLMPNHFHLLVRQTKNNGISEFISKLTNSYTKYFNTKRARVGPLLQGQFKAVLVETDEQLLHLSRYIHLNPLVSLLISDLSKYQWSSYAEFNQEKEGLCNKQVILSEFKSPYAYRQFVMDRADYGKNLEVIKHKLLDEH